MWVLDVEYSKFGITGLTECKRFRCMNVSLSTDCTSVGAVLSDAMLGER